LGNFPIERTQRKNSRKKEEVSCLGIYKKAFSVWEKAMNRIKFALTHSPIGRRSRPKKMAL
jgi:hypothetical protein